jgi:hypothetical protein
LTGLIHFQRRAQAPKRILAAEPSFEEAEYFGDGAVILQPTHVSKTLATHQTVESKSIEDVFNGGGVGTCAGQRIILGEFIQDPSLTQEVIPRHKTTVGSQSVVRSSKVEFTARWVKFKIKGLFTPWVNAVEW